MGPAAPAIICYNHLQSKTNGNDGNDTMMHLGRNLALSSRFGWFMNSKADEKDKTYILWHKVSFYTTVIEAVKTDAKSFVASHPKLTLKIYKWKI